MSAQENVVENAGRGTQQIISRDSISRIIIASGVCLAVALFSMGYVLHGDLQCGFVYLKHSIRANFSIQVLRPTEFIDRLSHWHQGMAL
jgi:hypothetical protein